MSELMRSEAPRMSSAWNKVFASANPGEANPSTLAFRFPFSGRIESAVLLFPLDGYRLTRIQFEALVGALDVTGLAAEPAYLSIYEVEQNFLDSWFSEIRDARTGVVEYEPCHFEFRVMGGYEAYHHAPAHLSCEHAMYGSSGRWGLIVSHEMHAVLGGSRAFIDEFKSRYGWWQRDVAELDAYWKDNPNGGWLKELLADMQKVNRAC